MQASTQQSYRTSHRGRKLKNEGTRMACPHCGAECEIRTSRVLTKTMRETIYGCTNVECGHIGVVLAEFVRTLTPSATPDPTIKLPFSSHIERGLLQIMLNNAGTAEHLPLYTTPKTGQLFTEPDISNNTS